MKNTAYALLILLATTALLSCFDKSATIAKEPSSTAVSSQALLSSSINPSSHAILSSSSTTASPKDVLPIIAASFPSWKLDQASLDSIRWQYLDRIQLSFALPTEDGHLDISQIPLLKAFADSARANSVESILALGGAAGSEAFTVFAPDAGKRNTFVQEVVQSIIENGFDGADLDWEHWPQNGVIDSVWSQAFVSLSQELAAALHAAHKKYSVDLFASDWFGKHVFTDALESADWITTMTFDGSGAWSLAGPHSDFNLVQSGTSYWAGRMGEEIRSKLCFTIPFYGYEFDSDYTKGEQSKVRSILYEDLLEKYPEAHLSNSLETENSTIWYDGFPALAEKIAWAKTQGTPCLMVWENTMDVRDERSLLTEMWRLKNLP